MNKSINATKFNESDIVSFRDTKLTNALAIDKYVTKYRSFLKHTAESILGLAETLSDAKVNLNGVDFHMFCDEVGAPEKGPTYNKLMKIA